MRVSLAGPICRGRRAAPDLVLAAAAFSLTVVDGAAVFGPTTSGATTPEKSVRPVLSPLTPDVGHAGETLALVGTGFYGADGEIVATFGSRLASCALSDAGALSSNGTDPSFGFAGGPPSHRIRALHLADLPLRVIRDDRDNR